MGLFSKIFQPKTAAVKEQPKVEETPDQNIKKTVMSDTIKFTIDGKECTAHKGANIVEAAKQNGVYIPTLCHVEGIKPAGSCRLCNVKINGRYMTACTTEVVEGMVIENKKQEIEELRKIIIETLFVSGNHFCPACEKSGNCELQAMGYKYQMMVPRFPYEFDEKQVDANSTRLYIDRNRCILCKRCVRSIKTKDGKSIFAIKGRGHHAIVNIDHKLANQMTDEEAQEAMDTCPVGSILKKERGYVEPIGTRKYDSQAIGSEIEKNVN